MFFYKMYRPLLLCCLKQSLNTKIKCERVNNNGTSKGLNILVFGKHGLHHIISHFLEYYVMHSKRKLSSQSEMKRKRFNNVYNFELAVPRC